MLKLLKSTIIGLMIAGFTAGCVKTDDIEVVALKSEKANLQGYKTYQIIDESGFAKDSAVPDNLDINTELQQIVNAELAKKGKMPVTKNPDFYVAYLAAADMDAIKEKVDKKGQVRIESAPAAAMLLVLIDADTAEIIYLSSAQGDVKGLPLDEKRKRLNYAIKEMLGAM
jgi:Domain of unknown function (DUF4136)